jgi:dihydrofolate reductase
MISIIVAIDKNGIIAKNGEIPWCCHEDLLYFKTKTIGKPIIMGKTTFETIKKPLIGRLNIILDGDFKGSNNLQVGDNGQNYFVFNNIEDALTTAIFNYGKNCEIMVCGGLGVYTSFIDLGIVDKIYVNRIKEEIKYSDNDKVLFFPFRDGWIINSSEYHERFISYTLKFDPVAKEKKIRSFK